MVGTKDCSGNVGNHQADKADHAATGDQNTGDQASNDQIDSAPESKIDTQRGGGFFAHQHQVQGVALGQEKQGGQRHNHQNNRHF